MAGAAFAVGDRVEKTQGAHAGKQGVVTELDRDGDPSVRFDDGTAQTAHARAFRRLSSAEAPATR